MAVNITLWLSTPKPVPGSQGTDTDRKKDKEAAGERVSEGEHFCSLYYQVASIFTNVTQTCVLRTGYPLWVDTNTVEDPVSGHPREAEKVFATGAGR